MYRNTRRSRKGKARAGSALLAFEDNRFHIAQTDEVFRLFRHLVCVPFLVGVWWERRWILMDCPRQDGQPPLNKSTG